MTNYPANQSFKNNKIPVRPDCQSAVCYLCACLHMQGQARPCSLAPEAFRLVQVHNAQVTHRLIDMRTYSVSRRHPRRTVKPSEPEGTRKPRHTRQPERPLHTISPAALIMQTGLRICYEIIFESGKRAIKNHRIASVAFYIFYNSLFLLDCCVSKSDVCCVCSRRKISSLCPASCE